MQTEAAKLCKGNKCLLVGRSKGRAIFVVAVRSRRLSLALVAQGELQSSLAIADIKVDDSTLSITEAANTN
jgi:hypothetical protein